METIKLKIMDINDLTLGQIKEIQKLSEINNCTKNKLTRYVGKYVIVRSRNEGINAGEVLEYDETGIILKEARRLWYHKPNDKKTAWYEGVSVSGLSKDSKISCKVSEKAIVEEYSITLCSEKAELSIKEKESHEQN